jgi:hypothetical protein
MIIFLLATIISITISILISFHIDNIGSRDIFILIFLFYCILYATLEILKWPFGKRKIDNSKGLARYIYGEAANSWYKRPYFSPRESIINIKGKGSYAVWVGFIGSLFVILLLLIELFPRHWR